VKHCATCGQDIADSATHCEDCSRVADFFAPASAAVGTYEPEPVPARVAAAPVLPAAPIAAAPSQSPSPSPSTSPSPSRPALGHRELLLIAVVALGIGAVTMVMLFARGASSSTVAAAAADAARRSAPAAPMPIAPATQKWSTENRTFWLATQRHSAAFELHAENMVTTWQGRVRPSLVVRCVSRKMETFVFTHSAMKIEPHAQDKTVTIAFDDEPMRTDRWPDSEDHDALFAPDGPAFALRLTHARTLRFGYTPHNVDPVVAEFRVSGLAELIDPVANDCGWPK